MRTCDVSGYRPRQGIQMCVAILTGLVLMPVGIAKGKMDLSGVWEAYHVSHGPAKTSSDVFVDEPLSALTGNAPRLREPYASAYQALQKTKRAADEAGHPLADSRTQCLPEGMPEMMMAILPIEILQTDKEIVVLTELLAQTRRIYMNRKMPPLEDIVSGYFGYSVGRWEGTKLVVETQGIREDVLFMDLPHSPRMKITERFRLVGGALEDHIVIDDPDVLVEPYRFAYKYKRNRDYQIGEYVCDNNRYRINQNGAVELD